MSALVRSYSKGGYRAGEQATIVAHRMHKPNGNARGCLAFHGATQDATWAYDPSYSDKPNAIADARYPVLAFDMGDPAVATGTTSGPRGWGNDNSITSTASAATFLKATESYGQVAAGPGAKTDKFYIYGASMGALTALNYAISLATPANTIAAMAFVVGVLDLDDIYQNNKGSAQANIGAAYGVTYPTAIPNLATHSPAAYSGANLAKLTMPIKLWAASDDPIASDTTHATTWATSVGSNVTVVDMGAVGHSVTPAVPADVVAFCQANP